MKNFILIISLALFQNAVASYEIMQYSETDELVSLYLDNAEIVEFESSNLELVEKAKNAFETSSLIETVKISTESDQPDLIADILILPQLSTPAPTKEYDPIDPLSSDYLTTFSTYQDAQTIMDTFNGETSDDSQCYNRAHMWTYEANSLHQAHLGKVWIFFTKKYIREYKYKWWFHISPYAKVADANELYVVDRGFTMVPYNLTNWKNIFIKSQAECPVVKDYREYERNQEAHHCYFIFSTQHYWQPQHLKRLATKGQIQNQYNKRDLRITYRNALIRWDGQIPDQVLTPEPVPERRRPPSTPDRIIRDVEVGDWVISPNGVDGRVTKVFGGGNIRVKYVSMAREVLQHTRDLALRVGSSQGYRVGDRVLSRDRMAGVVTGVFADGSLAVKFGHMTGHTRRYPENLSLH